MLMLKRESGDIAICCVEMIEDNDGDFRLGELHTFCTENWQSSANSGWTRRPMVLCLPGCDGCAARIMR